jgi:lysozyme
MSVADFFDAARALKREMTDEGLTQAEVNALNAIIDQWTVGLQPSQAAFDLIKEFEGYATAYGNGGCKAYPDPASGGDPWTIGFGSTGPDVRPGTVWTRQQAEDRLKADVTSFAAGVAKLIGSTPTLQREFDALVSLAYNIGLGNFGGSTLLKKHKANDKAGAAAEFGKWRMAAGKVMKGLIRRRTAEAALYRGQS